MQYIVGVDLGQVADYTAIVVLEGHRVDLRGELTTYHLRYAERLLGQPYPVIVAQVKVLMTHLDTLGRTTLVVDGTGCGRPVIDMLVHENLYPIAVTITGGDQVHQDGRSYRTPKRDLVGALQVLLQTERLKIAEQLPLAPTLVQELLAFRVRIDPATAHDSYSSWREKDHDDLVLATALACWWGERFGSRRVGTWGLRF